VEHRTRLGVRISASRAGSQQLNCVFLGIAVFSPVSARARYEARSRISRQMKLRSGLFATLQWSDRFDRAAVGAF